MRYWQPVELSDEGVDRTPSRWPIFASSDPDGCWDDSPPPDGTIDD